MAELSHAFHDHDPGDGFTYDPVGAWDTRNTSGILGHPFHGPATDRAFATGDVVFRGRSGVSFRRYAADIDRVWSIGPATSDVQDLYRLAWECNRAMASAIRPGVTCADVYAAGAAVEKRHGWPDRLTGRTGHGYRNVGGLSVFPGCMRVLEPGMLLSVEPLFATSIGFFDLEDQYVVTETGAECLHDPAPEALPICG
jgi:Xaa-Pro aminopeptidase